MQTDQTPPPVTFPELWDKLTICNSRLSECVNDPDSFEELQQLLAAFMTAESVSGDDLITLILYSHGVHAAADKLRREGRTDDAVKMFDYAQSYLVMALRTIAHISMSQALSHQVIKARIEAAEFGQDGSLVQKH